MLRVSVGRKSAQQGLGTSRLPTFAPQEKSYIKGTCDFLGIGHFTTRYITQKNYPSGRSGNSYFTDRDLAELVDPRWPDPGSEWLYSVPWGFRRMLNFIKVGVELNGTSDTQDYITYLQWLQHIYFMFLFLLPYLDSVWKPSDLRDGEWSLWEDAVHRALWWVEDTVF